MNDVPMIQCQGVSKSYQKGKTTVTPLERLDLSVLRAEFLALMGPSGSGKTTLLNLLSGIDSPSEGSLVIAGTELAGLSRRGLTRWRAQHVGYIFQLYHLVPVLTAFENVELPLLLSPLSKRERHQRVQSVLELVGLGERMHHTPSELSGGQEQRVAIARALVADPPLLVADEPTGDLDKASASHILGLLQTLSRQHGKTIVMVTHDPRAAEAAHRTLHLEKRAAPHNAMNGLTNLIHLAAKQLIRHRLRTLFTVLGVASGMFLFTAVETLQHSLTLATEANAVETVLVVYRQNRFCPSTSRLPEHYADEISRIDGVREVIPVQIVVNNCGASLDVITFRGVPEGSLPKFAPEIQITSGSMESWNQRDDGALLGEVFAARRGLKPGDKFSAAGVAITVSAIIRSPFPQDNNVAYVKLPFLQQASRVGLGVVTQFNVRVKSSSDLERVSKAIDERFHSDQQPTDTRPENAFFAETASGLVELIGFTRWLGLGAVLAVTALVANALLLIVRGRVKENAVFRTLGYPDHAIGCLVISEGGMLGLAGGALGVGLSSAFLRWQSFTLGSEGLTLAIRPDWGVAFTGLVAALLLGLFASLWPAWQAISQSIVKNLRS